MEHPRCYFANYSAVTNKNISAVIINMFDNYLGLYYDEMFATFDQKFCKSSPEITGEKWGFIRDLNMIWESQPCKDLYK